MDQLNSLLNTFIKENEDVKRTVDERIKTKNYDGKEYKDNFERAQYYSVFKIRFEQAKPFLKRQFQTVHQEVNLFDNLITASLMAAKKNVSYLL